MLKKTITILMAALMSATLFGACGAQKAEKAAPAPEPAASAASEATPAASEATPATLPETFVLGLDASFPPMGFTDANNQIIGVDIDIAKAVCDKLGMKFEAKPIDWASKEMELNTGKITCIWNGMTVTEERAKAFNLTPAYMNNDQVIVVMEDSAVKVKADLAGKVVAAQSDSSGLKALQKDAVFASIKDGAAKEYADYVTALGDLELGRVDAIVMDSVVANYYITQNKKAMTVLEDKMAAEEYAIAFRKGTNEAETAQSEALKAAVEGAMSELAAEGKIAEISKEWFGKEDVIITY